MNIDYRRLAKGSFLFASLPDPVADKLLAHAFVRSYAQGTTIFLQGQPADAIFVVLDGWVKLFRTTPAGAEAIVGEFRATVRADLRTHLAHGGQLAADAVDDLSPALDDTLAALTRALR